MYVLRTYIVGTRGEDAGYPALLLCVVGVAHHHVVDVARLGPSAHDMNISHEVVT